MNTGLFDSPQASLHDNRLFQHQIHFILKETGKAGCSDWMSPDESVAYVRKHGTDFDDWHAKRRDLALRMADMALTPESAADRQDNVWL